jgi:CheY-like chemotaxis protein
VLDLMMPFMDGFAVLEALKADERTRDTPVMVLSALINDSVQQRCFSLGANTYMQKPFEGNQLIDAVEELLALRSETDRTVALQVDEV